MTPACDAPRRLPPIDQSHLGPLRRLSSATAPQPPHRLQPNRHVLQAYDDIEHFETSYVVKLFKFHPLAPTLVGVGRLLVLLL